MRIFISHSHNDAVLAEHFVGLLNGRFFVPNGALHCSSLSGYTLDLGRSTADTLRSELDASRVVIGLLTASSIRSSWVVSELGAAWGLGRTVAMIVMPGIEDSDIPGPLSGIVRIDLRGVGHPSPHNFANESQSVSRMQTLLDSIASSIDEPARNLGWAIKNGSNQEALLREFVASTLAYSSWLRAPEALETRESMLVRPHGLRWGEIAQYCQSELRIWGWSCMNAINGGSRAVFKDWLEGKVGKTGKSRKLQVLLMNHRALERSPINFGPVCCIKHDKVVADVKDALGRWKTWGTDCGFGSDQLEILETDWIMAFSGVAIDMDGPDGLVQAEFYSYNTPDHLAARPNLITRVGSAYWDPLKRSVAELFNSGTSA